MKAVYVQRIKNVRSPRVALMNYHYGASATHNVDGIGAIAVGSNIPGGRFVVYGPNSQTQPHNFYRTVMLPDRTGTHLIHNDKKTNFADDVAAMLDANNEFPMFAGVTRSGMNTCKDDCLDEWQCCPIGYEGEPQRNNWWRKLDNVDVQTNGKITVYAETDFALTDKVYVRVEVIDPQAVPCQMLGGVTNTPDAGTQEAPCSVSVEQVACAGEAVMLNLNGLKQC